MKSHPSGLNEVSFIFTVAKAGMIITFRFTNQFLVTLFQPQNLFIAGSIQEKRTASKALVGGHWAFGEILGQYVLARGGVSS